VAFVRPEVLSVPGDLVFFELSLVLGAVTPLEDTLSIEQTVTQFSFVLVPVFELACALSMVDFANLSVLFVVDDVATPVVDDQLCELGWQESHLG
jgi:hypothetical protein